MGRVAWVTDIHLNFVSPAGLAAFGRALAADAPDALLVGGDISEAPTLVAHLEALAAAFGPRPIYFVLGNHDFYRGSIAGVYDDVERFTRAGGAGPAWLPACGVVALSERTGLVGADGWGDARLGDFTRSSVWLNDYVLIAELAAAAAESRAALAARLGAFGDRWAAHVRAHVPPALARFEHVVFLTHVPPFEAACWYDGRISDANWLPHFTCKAVGDALLECAAAAPQRRLTVLCGHTHGAGEAHPAPNVHVYTGAADYGAPALQRLLPV